jgi:hypothetical protein
MCHDFVALFVYNFHQNLGMTLDCGLCDYSQVPPRSSFLNYSLVSQLALSWMHSALFIHSTG